MEDFENENKEPLEIEDKSLEEDNSKKMDIKEIDSNNSENKEQSDKKEKQKDDDINNKKTNQIEDNTSQKENLNESNDQFFNKVKEDNEDNNKEVKKDGLINNLYNKYLNYGGNKYKIFDTNVKEAQKKDLILENTYNTKGDFNSTYQQPKYYSYFTRRELSDSEKKLINKYSNYDYIKDDNINKKCTNLPISRNKNQQTNMSDRLTYERNESSDTLAKDIIYLSQNHSFINNQKNDNILESTIKHEICNDSIISVNKPIQKTYDLSSHKEYYSPLSNSALKNNKITEEKSDSYKNNDNTLCYSFTHNKDNNCDNLLHQTSLENCHIPHTQYIHNNYDYILNKTEPLYHKYLATNNSNTVNNMINKPYIFTRNKNDSGFNGYNEYHYSPSKYKKLNDKINDSSKINLNNNDHFSNKNIENNKNNYSNNDKLIRYYSSNSDYIPINDISNKAIQSKNFTNNFNLIYSGKNTNSDILINTSPCDLYYNTLHKDYLPENYETNVVKPNKYHTYLIDSSKDDEIRNFQNEKKSLCSNSSILANLSKKNGINANNQISKITKLV